MSGMRVILTVLGPVLILSRFSYPPAENQRGILWVKGCYYPSFDRLFCVLPYHFVGVFGDSPYVQMAAVAGIVITWLYLRAAICG